MVNETIKEEQNTSSQNNIDLNQYDSEVSTSGTGMVIAHRKNDIIVPGNQNSPLFITDSRDTTVREVTSIESEQSKASSQNELNLDNFEEEIYPPTETLPKQSIGITLPSFTLAREKKPQPDINLSHEEALRKNRERNMGFTNGLSAEGVQALEDIDDIARDLRGKNFERLTDLMEPGEARRYEDTMREKEEKTLSTPELRPESISLTPEPTEKDRLTILDETLEETNKILEEIDLNIQTLQKQGIENLSREQMIEYLRLIQKQSELITKTYEIQQEKNKIAIEKVIEILQKETALTSPTSEEPTSEEPTSEEPTSEEPTSEEPISEEPISEEPISEEPISEEPISEEPISEEPTSEPTPEPTSEPTPEPTSSDSINYLEDQLSELRRENTPEQQSAALGRELAALEEKLASVGLTDAEKITYFDILKAKENIDKQINRVEQESKKKRERKEKIIKIAAGIAGVGVALTTPALGVAAVIGITFGGRTLGRAMQRQSERLRSQSNSIKYESRKGKTLIELEEMDRKQKRKEFWADRLGEVSAVLIGGSTGYAIGTLFEGIVGKDFQIGGGKPPETPVGTSTTSSTNTPASASESGSLGGNTPSAQASTPNSTMPDATTIGTSPESWLTEETFNASDLGWDYKDMGWLGDEIHLTELGGEDGIMQGEFFQKLSELVPKEKLAGPASGNIVNQFLRLVYAKGLDPVVAAQKAAETLLSR